MNMNNTDVSRPCLEEVIMFTDDMHFISVYLCVFARSMTFVRQVLSCSKLLRQSVDISCRRRGFSASQVSYGVRSSGRT